MAQKAEFLSVARQASAEFIERKSRFISHVAPTGTEDEAMGFLASVRAVHPGATHNCWAYVVGLSGQYQRASDDGEPSGTAGRPILDVIIRQGIVNVVVVVTRYFGGILLGAGGLVRAYTEAAKIGLEAGGIARAILTSRMMLAVDYSLYGKVQRELENRKIPVDSVDFGSDVTVVARIRSDEFDSFRDWLVDTSAGVYAPEVIEEIYCPVDDAGVLLV